MSLVQATAALFLLSLQVSWGPLEFKKCMLLKEEVGEEEREGNGMGCPQEGELFSLSCRWGS